MHIIFSPRTGTIRRYKVFMRFYTGSTKTITTEKNKLHTYHSKMLPRFMLMTGAHLTYWHQNNALLQYLYTHKTKTARDTRTQNTIPLTTYCCHTFGGRNSATHFFARKHIRKSLDCALPQAAAAAAAAVQFGSVRDVRTGSVAACALCER